MATNYYNSGAVAASNAATIAFMEAGLTATGWTLVDTPTTHRVWQSPDIVTGVHFFIDFFVSGGVLTVDAYVDYDVTNHAGIQKAPGGSVSTFGGTGYVYANALGLVYAILDGISNPVLFFGQPRCRQQVNVTDGLCLSTAGISAAATSVSVDRDLTTRLYVGQVIAIQNFAHNSASANKDNRELVTITSLSAGSIGISATANAYDSGAKIGPPDMLWPLAANPSGIRSFTAGCVSMSAPAMALDQSVNTTVVDVGPFNPLNGNANAQSNAESMNAAGYQVESTNAAVTSHVSAFPIVMLGITGIIMVLPNYSGGAPANGAKLTDGTNVFVIPKGATAAGSGMTFAIGPTGDAPNRSTQLSMLPPPLGVTDTIYMTEPPAGSAPSNALNQGLN